MSKPDTERAEKILTASIDAQSIAAAKAYPELKILCLRCGVSVMGADFAQHLHEHALSSLKDNIPSSWEAL